LNLTHDCCEINVDTLPLGEIQLETPIKSIPTHDWDLYLAIHKVENVRKLVDEQEWKVTHTAEKKYVIAIYDWGPNFCSVVLPFVLLLPLPLL
jgi:hypothetical protein